VLIVVSGNRGTEAIYRIQV